MNIAFISTILHYPWGGADTMWTRAAEAALARGDRLLLSISPLTAAHARIEALRNQGAAIHLRQPTLPPTSPLRRLKRKLGFRSEQQDSDLINVLEIFRPDLVVFSFGGTYDLTLHRRLTAWLRLGEIKFRGIANWQAEHPHLSIDDLSFIRSTFGKAEKLYFVSTRNRAITRRHLLDSLPHASVVHNPLRWQPADRPPWAHAPEVRLASVSRLDRGKGLHLLLHALSEASPKLASWRLEMFGTGPQEAELHAIISDLKLDDRVSLRGHVGALRDIWTNNQLLCAPALEDGVPMTIPEAMLCGRPVLSTKVGGAEDWIEHGRTGFLCASPTVPDLARSLVEAFAFRDRWIDFGQAAGEAAAKLYRPNDYLEVIN